MLGRTLPEFKSIITYTSDNTIEKKLIDVVNLGQLSKSDFESIVLEQCPFSIAIGERVRVLSDNRDYGVILYMSNFDDNYRKVSFSIDPVLSIEDDGGTSHFFKIKEVYLTSENSQKTLSPNGV